MPWSWPRPGCRCGCSGATPSGSASPCSPRPSTPGLFVWTLTRVSRRYWRQSLLLIVAVLLPSVANLAHNLNLGPFRLVEPTPFLFVLTGAVLVWGLFRFRLFDLAPAARTSVFETMLDAALVLDPYRRVVKLNPAAERALGVPAPRAVGRQVEQLLEVESSLVERADDPVLPEEVELAGHRYELSATRPGRPQRPGHRQGGGAARRHRAPPGPRAAGPPGRAAPLAARAGRVGPGGGAAPHRRGGPRRRHPDHRGRPADADHLPRPAHRRPPAPPAGPPGGGGVVQPAPAPDPGLRPAPSWTTTGWPPPCAST